MGISTRNSVGFPPRVSGSKRIPLTNVAAAQPNSGRVELKTRGTCAKPARSITNSIRAEPETFSK
jgi:hypothetical protein